MGKNFAYRNKDIVSEDFIHIHSDFSIGKIKQTILDSKVSYVIISDKKTGNFYLHKSEDLIRDLERIANEKKIQEFLYSTPFKKTPTVDADDYLRPFPCPAIVMSGGYLAGFYTRESWDIETIDGLKNTKSGGDLSLNPDRRHISSSKSATAFFLNAEFPRKTKPGNPITILVSVNMRAERDINLPVDVKSGSKIDVIIQAKSCFEIIGKDHHEIVVTEDNNTLPVLFKAQADTIGQGKLRLFAFSSGVALGFMDMIISIVASTETQPEEVPRIEVRESINLFMAPVPDLQFLVTEQALPSNKSKIIFHLIASNPNLELNHGPFEPVILYTGLVKYFQDFFRDIESLSLKNINEKEIAFNRMEAKGLRLFELFPDKLQKLLWELRNEVKTVNFISEEVSVPWEICKLSGTENKYTVNGGFFCEVFKMSRWIVGKKAPRATFNFSKIALVVPKDSKLQYANYEKETLIDMFTAAKCSVDVIPADTRSILSSFSNSQYSVWHFTGHGGSLSTEHPDRSVIFLENGEYLTPEDISGQIKNLGLAKPLIFLNACRIGIPEMGLTGIGGWASQFLGAGAAGFIGAYWSIYDKPASDFAINFYKNLLSGLTIGEATLNAKVSIKNFNDPTWLSYSVYADPYAKVAF